VIEETFWDRHPWLHFGVFMTVLISIMFVVGMVAWQLLLETYARPCESACREAGLVWTDHTTNETGDCVCVPGKVISRARQ
jgi:hypothetical protein